MENIYTELALYGSKNECAQTDNVFSPISEVCDGTVSLLGLCCLREGGGPVLNKLETKKFLDSVDGHNQPCILLPKQLPWKKCVTSDKNLICITIAYRMSRQTED